jgi:two-component system, OmpR family, response regulator
MPYRILIADDEPQIREVLRFALERAGMEVTVVRNGAEAVQQALRGGLDLMVLDIGMPEMDGLEVCRKLRGTTDIPILFLSARNEEIDRVLGLEMGGDDYVTKPFSPREVVARVGAILKRSKQTARPTSAREHGRLMLDPEGHLVRYAELDVALTALEFAILAALMEREGVVLSRDRLIDVAYGPSMHVAERTIDSHVRNIRAKFATAGRPGIIATVHGVGFKLGETA